MFIFALKLTLINDEKRKDEVREGRGMRGLW